MQTMECELARYGLVEFDLSRFDTSINRSDAEALIPEEALDEIIKTTTETSTIMQLGRRLPNMSRNQLRMPVASALVQAGYVNGDAGQKQTSTMAWQNKFVDAEEIAVIVPIPENVLDDEAFDIWGEVRESVGEAFGIAFDAAVIHGTDGFGGGAPSSWPTALVPGAVEAGHAVTRGSGDDLYDEIMAEGGVISFVEEDGWMVDGYVAALTARAQLRGLRDHNGQPLFHRNAMQGGPQWDLDGSPVEFPRNGAIDPNELLLLAGQWNQLVWSMRTDLTFRVLDQAVIQDSQGNIVHNLAQDDMLALRVKMRLGWELPNPVNRVNPEEASRYPFSVLLPEGS